MSLEALKKEYKFESEIGRGGMAVIRKAIELKTNRVVAIKIVSADQKDAHKAKRRFLSEIKAIKQIDSPFVVKAYDYLWTDESQYIIMEYIKGSMLKEYIAKRGRLNADEVVEFTKQIALGLYQIHKCDVIHRDIKSSNIMITDKGTMKIIDFGIALHDEAERVTQTDSIIGSVQYLAPELLDKVDASPQSDIYALGILMFEMLTGEVPFKGKNSLETAMKHKRENVPQVNTIFPNIPQSVANIITKATAHNPALRYKSAYEMYKDLDSSLTAARQMEKAISLNKKPKKSFSQRLNSKTALWIIATVGTVLISGLITLIVLLTI